MHWVTFWIKVKNFRGNCYINLPLKQSKIDVHALFAFGRSTLPQSCVRTISMTPKGTQPFQKYSTYSHDCGVYGFLVDPWLQLDGWRSRIPDPDLYQHPGNLDFLCVYGLPMVPWSEPDRRKSKSGKKSRSSKKPSFKNWIHEEISLRFGLCGLDH